MSEFQSKVSMQVEASGQDVAALENEQLSLDGWMRIELPRLKEAVKNRWKNYRFDPSHAQVDAMRKEVQLLIYWLARYVAKSGKVHFRDGDVSRQVRVGEFGGLGCTELQHQIYENVLSRHTVTQLVAKPRDDLVNYLHHTLVNEKTDMYRKWRTERQVMQDLSASGTDEDAASEVDQIQFLGHDLTPERIVEALDCLEQFVEFMEAERLNPKLEQIVWALWMSAPLSDKAKGDLSDNRANTDARLAESLGIPKKTFDRYKPMARALVERFREQSGY